MMEMKPNKQGFYDEQTVMASGLPVVDFGSDPNSYCETSWFSYTDLKNILKIELTDEERKKCIVAFEKSRNNQGYVALYSFMDILCRRG